MIVLARPDRGVAVVVDDEELDRQVEANDRFQLLDVQLKAAVAVDADRPLPTAREAPADAGGKPEPHRAQAAGAEQTLPLLHGEREPERVDADTGAAGDDQVVAVE